MSATRSLEISAEIAAQEREQKKRDGKMLEHPRDQAAVTQDVEETINNWSTTELLDAISLELEEKEAKQ